MAVIHGKDGEVKVGSTGVEKLTNWTLNRSIATADATGAGEDDETHTLGAKSASGTIDVRYDDAATGQDALVFGTSVTLNLYHEGDSSGKDYYSFTATIESDGLTVPYADNETRQYQYKVNGAITEGTVA